MASKKEKSAFLVYHDWETFFDSLDSNEEAGELIRALFAFAKRGEITEFSGALKMAFIFMSQQIEADSEKWKEVCEKRKEAINKRWNEKNTKDTNEYNSIQKIQMNTSDTDNDNDNVNENDNVNVNDNDNDNDNISIKENKQKKNSIAEYQIAEYTDNPELIQVLKDYVKSRRAMKAPNTERAVTLFLNRLNELAPTDYQKIKVVEKSIERGWKTFYPLKEEEKKSEEYHTPTAADYDFSDWYK